MYIKKATEKGNNIMKKLFIALTAAALVLTFCACGNSGNEKSGASGTTSASSVSAQSKAEASDVQSSDEKSDVQSEAVSEQQTGNLQQLLEKVKAEVTMPAETADFNAKRMKRTFGIESDWMDDFAGLYCTDGLTQDQIVYVQAKDEAAADEIEKKLQDNWQSKYNVIKNYSPEQVANIESAKVERNGLYVSLVISADADKIKSIFNEGIN